MNTSVIILIILASGCLVALGYALYAQFRKIKNLESKVKFFEENQSDDLLGKAKFSELGLMSAGIAHEINNPVSIIQLRAQQLLRTYRNPGSEKELASGLQQILYTTERIGKTVQGIREFIYQDSQNFENEISIKDIFENVLVFCGQRLKNHGIELRLINLDDLRVSGHKVQYEQAILNLINNSFDAIDDLKEKWIEVTGVEGDEFVRLFFKDSGSGIPDEVATHMMSAFYTTKKDKGTGLGLALVKGIAENHGGHLEYVKNADHTTFLLELPKSIPIYLKKENDSSKPLWS